MAGGWGIGTKDSCEGCADVSNTEFSMLQAPVSYVSASIGVMFSLQDESRSALALEQIKSSDEVIASSGALPGMAREVIVLLDGSWSV